MRRYVTSKRALAGVMAILLLSVFLPAKAARLVWDPFRHGVQLVAFPIADPLHAVGIWARGSAPDDVPLGPELQRDANLRDALRYIRKLELELQQKQELLAQLNRSLAVRQDVQLVVGSATSWPRSSESLHLVSINIGRRQGLVEGQVVIDGDTTSLAGRLSDVGPNSATVRLITSAQTRLEVLIMPPDAGPATRQLQTVVNIDDAQSAFTARVTTDDVARIGDLVHLADPAWEAGNGYLVGVVSDVQPDPANALWRIVTVQPVRDMLQVRRLFVIVATDVQPAAMP